MYVSKFTPLLVLDGNRAQLGYGRNMMEGIDQKELGTAALQTIKYMGREGENIHAMNIRLTLGP